MELRLHFDQFWVVRGRLTIVGRQPDGDSIRFIPDDEATLRSIPHASRLRQAKDGSVQLRLDGIDAPETHFVGQSQPLGDVAREQLLKIVGFDDVTYDASGTVTSSTPQTLTATIMVSLLDPYGRPVSYLLPGHDTRLPDGSLMTISNDILAKTANIQLLSSGAAYITLYNSTPPSHRQYLQSVAQKAKDANKGVWAVDSTSQFTLDGQASIGPASGVVMLPKLFRRAVHYLQALDAGFQGTFPLWVQGTASQIYHSEDDYVILPDGSTKHLHELLHEDNSVVTTDIDPLNDVFIEQ